MTRLVTLQVLKRINSEIEARRKAGENLPPPPKTAIAGPEYFGLNQPEVHRQTLSLSLSCEKKREEKTAPIEVSLMRSQ